MRRAETVVEEALVARGDTVPLELRLAQTIAWCRLRLRTGESAGAALRSEDLRPRVLEENRASAVNSVLGLRERYLTTRPASIRTIDDLEGGRLLLYFPDEDLACGAAAAETHGFFDVNNTPPWDTWVGLFRDGGFDVGADYLVSWKPLVAMVSRGIDVNPEGCRGWLSDSSTRVAKMLRTRGLLV